MPRIAAYGSWKSPFTPELVATSSGEPGGIAIDGFDIYWLESRPAEAGRYTVMCRSHDGSLAERTPGEFNVRTTVHEYGGGAFTVSRGILYFVNYRDQQVYRQAATELPRRLRSADGCRYADLVVDPIRNRLVCVREDHRGEGEAINALISMSCTGKDLETTLASGNDFYSSPAISPDGSRLAYLTWNHPNMPWDGCQLWVAELEEVGALRDPHQVAGGPHESIFQPQWSPSGVLHFVSDRTGWWNLYRWTGQVSELVLPMEAEFGRAQFQFGMSLYAFISPTKILCVYSQDGIWHLASLGSDQAQLTPLPVAYTEISHVHCGDGFAAFIGGNASSSSAVIELDLKTGRVEALTHDWLPAIDPAHFSLPQSIDFPTEGGLQAHGFYYAPHNPDYVAPTGDLPPLLVMSHGGPTSAASTTLALSTQFWTSRGLAVLDVNYGGSIGYGRAYRERLLAKWGIVDVDDCCQGALFLSKTGRADRKRLAIRGKSAGGYTTLACLAFRNDVFAAGASLYGVADLEDFARDTHKFESRYLNSLVGPYPEGRDLYHARSPIHHVDGFHCPLILLQGAEDRVVPPSQARTMFAAVRSKGLPVALVIFPGEQHGFRQAANIKRSLEAELYFYSKVFGFKPADPIDPIEIENL